MKFLFAILLFTLLGVALTRKLTEDMLFSSTKLCLTELGINVETFLDKVDDEFLVEEDNDELNTLIKCMLEKENALDEGNGYKQDVVKSILIRYVGGLNSNIRDVERAADDALDSCKRVDIDTYGSDVGNRFIKVSNCFVKYIANVKYHY